MKLSKELKIGVTGVVALVVLFIGINFLKGVNLFSNQSTYYIRFSNAKALSKSSTVYADGINVGIVSGVLYDYRRPGEVFVQIAVDHKLRIPKGSTAQLDEAMLGGCTLNLLLATNLQEAYHPGDTIPGSDATGLMAKAADMVPQLEGVVAKLDTLLASLNKLATDSSLPLIMQNTEGVTANLNRSTVQLNHLLEKDIPLMANTFTKAGENVVTLTDRLNQLQMQTTLDSLNNAISSMHQLMTQVQSTDGTLGLMMNDPQIYNNLNHTIQSADSLMNDLKNHPKRYVHFSVFGKKQ